MNSWKRVLIIVLALACFGCHKSAKRAEQPTTSMEEEIRKIEAAAESEKATPKEAMPAAVEEKASAAETAPAADDALIESLNKASGAAKVGIINTLGERRDPKAVGALEGLIYDNDAAVASAAVEAIGKIGGFEAAKALSGARKKTSGELRNLVLHSYMDCAIQFAEKGDRVAAVVIFQQLCDANEPMQIRIAALKAIGKLGGASDVRLLAETAAGGGIEEREIARESLYRLGGADVDKAIEAALKEAEPKVKVELIKAIGERDIISAADNLLLTAKETDPRVRFESFKALRIIGGAGQLPGLIELLKVAPTQGEAKELEKTIAAVANRISDETQRASAVIEAMENAADTNVKSLLINVLGKIGTDEALAAVRGAMNDKDAKVQEAAIQTLADWPNAEPMEDLLQAAQNSTNQNFKVLALRGYIRLVGLDSQRPAEETVKLYMQAMGVAGSTSEKKMVLAAISSVKSYAAIEAAEGFLGDEQLGAEAAGAIIQIAEKTKGQDNPEGTKAALKKVIETAKSELLKKQAEETLSKIKN